MHLKKSKQPIIGNGGSIRLQNTAKNMQGSHIWIDVQLDSGNIIKLEIDTEK
jgi:hypothetical protein